MRYIITLHSLYGVKFYDGGFYLAEIVKQDKFENGTYKGEKGVFVEIVKIGSKFKVQCRSIYAHLGSPREYVHQIHENLEHAKDAFATLKSLVQQ